MAPPEGIEPPSDALEERCLSIRPRWFLLVPTSRIERLYTALQTAAMTTSAKLAYWCSYQESNLKYSLTKTVLCHLTIRAVAEGIRIELIITESKSVVIPFN